MRLSNAGEYAVRAMLHMASSENNDTCKIFEISKTWNIPESFLRKILVTLSKAGLVLSSRGASGGYTLAKSANSITLLDVVEAIDGKIFLNKCMIGSEMCTNQEWCPVHDVWIKAQTAYSEALKCSTLNDFVSNPKFTEYLNLYGVG